MGCDIHAYVEYSKTGEYWHGLTNNAGHRDYRMFGIMAGVRYEELKLFDPKGLPAGEMSWDTKCAYWKNVAPEQHPEWAETDGWISKDTAERWVAQGLSQPEFRDGVLKLVTDPDAHTPSWLSTSELDDCLNRYKEIADGKAPTEWLAILAAMKAIEGNGEIARVVFWFDN